MDEQENCMVFTCDAEEIIIETNIFSDESELSDVSDCLSESEYEEIELAPPCLKIEPYTISVIQSKTPYVGLTRCDHLLSNGSTLVIPQGDTIRSSNGSRSSVRRKLPNRNYKSDDFILHDFGLSIKSLRKQRSDKKKMSKNVRKAFASSENGISAENSTRNFNVSLTDKFMETGDETDQNHYRVTIDKIKLEHEDGDQLEFQDRKGDFSVQVSNEQSALMFQNFVVKSEPVDNYFDNTIDKDLNTVCGSDYVYYNVKQENCEDFTNTQNETEDSHTLSARKNSVVTAQETDTRVCVKYIDCSRTVYLRHEQSEGSDVDVENDWDSSKFIALQTLIDFDHCYHLPKNSSCDEIKANDKRHKKLLTNDKIKKTLLTNDRRQKTLLTNDKITKTLLTDVKRHKTLLKNDKRLKTLLKKSNRNNDKANKNYFGKNNITKELTSEENTTIERPTPGFLVTLAKHNSLERNRRKELACLFAELRDTIPELEGKEKTPKVDILVRAEQYIRTLEETQDEHVNSICTLTDYMEKLKLKLRVKALMHL